ncbi:hypothetical protein BX600DRAFT_451461 [Xylariales sp. PMI_506]|nr:hypothetical protein BX600DRAFT_451461 [Xylariales sp. PMI_506]
MPEGTSALAGSIILLLGARRAPCRYSSLFFIVFSFVPFSLKVRSPRFMPLPGRARWRSVNVRHVSGVSDARLGVRCCQAAARPRVARTFPVWFFFCSVVNVVERLSPRSHGLVYLPHGYKRHTLPVYAISHHNPLSLFRVLNFFFLAPTIRE